MTQYRLLLATLLAAFALAACGKQEAEVTEPAAPAPTADQAAPAAPAPTGEQTAPPAMEQAAPVAEDPKAAPPANN